MAVDATADTRAKDILANHQAREGNREAMARGQKAGAGGVRQQKRKGASSKKMFHKKPRAEGAASAPGRFAASKTPAEQHAAAAAAAAARPAGVPYRLGKGKEVQDDLLSANRQVIADIAKLAEDTKGAASVEDSDEDAGAAPESEAERTARIAHEAGVAKEVVSKPGWAPLAQRLNPQSKMFDAELKEDWDDRLSKDERQELNRIDGIEVAAAKKLGLITTPAEDKRLDMSLRELRAKVRASQLQITCDRASGGEHVY